MFYLEIRLWHVENQWKGKEIWVFMESSGLMGRYGSYHISSVHCEYNL